MVAIADEVADTLNGIMSDSPTFTLLTVGTPENESELGRPLQSKLKEREFVPLLVACIENPL